MWKIVDFCFTFCITFCTTGRLAGARGKCKETHRMTEGIDVNLVQRGKTLHLRRRVPMRYSSVERREYVSISLKTDSEAEARRKAGAAWDQMIAAWEARLAGDTAHAEAFYDSARNLCAARGFQYLPAAKVAELPLDDILARAREIRLSANGRPNMLDAAAFLGGAETPKITVSRALELYWGMVRERTRNKSPDQIRRWENPRKKAVANFIKVRGDMPIDEIGADDMLAFQNWWEDRIEEEGLGPGSANKDFGHLGHVLRTVNLKKHLNLALPLAGFKLRLGKQNTRPPFSDGWIRDKIIAGPKLMNLNTEARCVLLGLVNTGCRPSEISSLGPAQIRLDADVPHISVEPNGRELKTPHSERIIPLVGVSLDAFKTCPQGFPRYFDKPGLSATLNSFLRENDMLETPKHSVYSLRHSFEDRMLAAGVDERIRRDLMGHALGRQRYGAGATLESMRDILQAIAL